MLFLLVLLPGTASSSGRVLHSLDVVCEAILSLPCTQESRQGVCGSYLKRIMQFLRDSSM